MSGFNVESIRVPPLEFLVWDVSGQERLRTFWRHYYHGTTGIVFVVDVHDVERLPIARRELHGILKEEELNDAVLLIIANKVDLPNAVSTERLAQELDLASLQGRAMHIQPAVAQKGTGLKEGLVWLAKAMKAHSKQQARQQSAGSGATANAVQPSYPANGQQQAAHNYLNPYDTQAAGSSGSSSSATQQKQTQPVGSGSGYSATSTPSSAQVPVTNVVPVTLVSAPAASASALSAPQPLQPATIASVAAASTQSSLNPAVPNSSTPLPSSSSAGPSTALFTPATAANDAGAKSELAAESGAAAAGAAHIETVTADDSVQ